LNNPPANATVTWQATPSNRFINSSGTGTTATLRAASALVSSNTTLTFTLSACGVNAQVSKSVWVGKPANASNYDLTVQGSSANPVVLAGGSLYQFNMESVAGASSYMWMLPSGFSFMTGWPNNANIAKIWTPTEGGSYQLRCYPQNSCSSLGSTYQSLTINIQGPGDPPPCPDPPCEVPDPLRIYPNPANESVSVSFAKTGYNSYELLGSEVMETTEIRIYNSFSERVFEMRASGSTINIPVKHLPDGYYFLYTINRDGIIRRKLWIKH
jgi:hypothetical protein